MPYQLTGLLLALFNIFVPVAWIVIGLMVGGVFNRTVGVCMALVAGLAWLGVLWYQFVGGKGGIRYVLSTLDNPAGAPGYSPKSPPWWLPSEHVVLVIIALVASFLVVVVFDRASTH